jgi:hypothetical protein
VGGAHATPRPRGRGDAFALAYFWGTFVFFTLSSSRRSYYILAILPAAAFLIARLLANVEPLPRAARRLLVAGFALTAVAAVASIAMLLPVTRLLPEPWDRLPDVPCPPALVAAWLASAVGIDFALWKLSPRRIAAACSVVAGAFMLYLYVFALPAAEAYRTQRPFAEQVRQRVGDETGRLAVYRTREIVYYLAAPHPLPECHTPDELRQTIATHDLRWVLMRRRDWDAQTVSGQVVLAETVQSWESVELAGSKLVLVEVGGLKLDGEKPIVAAAGR